MSEVVSRQHWIGVEIGEAGASEFVDNVLYLLALVGWELG
jgi:hypothetical protein